MKERTSSIRIEDQSLRHLIRQEAYDGRAELVEARRYSCRMHCSFLAGTQPIRITSPYRRTGCCSPVPGSIVNRSVYISVTRSRRAVLKLQRLPAGGSLLRLGSSQGTECGERLAQDTYFHALRINLYDVWRHRPRPLACQLWASPH